MLNFELLKVIRASNWSIYLEMYVIVSTGTLIYVPGSTYYIGDGLVGLLCMRGFNFQHLSTDLFSDHFLVCGVYLVPTTVSRWFHGCSSHHPKFEVPLANVLAKTKTNIL